MLVLSLSAWTFGALGMGVLAAIDVSSLNLTALPDCGLACLSEVILASQCGLDFDCVCANTTIAADVEACLRDGCSVRDALISGKWSKDSCGIAPHDKSLVVWLVPLVAVILSTIFYALSIASRLVVRTKGIDLGDIIMGGCVLCTVPFLWTAFQLAEDGLGKDLWNIPYDNIPSILNLYWWDELFYAAILPWTKISILLFYLKVFPSGLIIVGSHALILSNFAYFIAFEFATIFQCFPIDGAWRNWDGSYDAYCGNIHAQSWASAGINIFLDIAVIVLPLPELAKLSISLRKKIQIMGMFSLGFFITIISIIRLKSLVVFANTTNATYDYVEPGLLSIMEAAAGIVCSCLPAVRALFSKLVPSLLGTTNNASTHLYSNSASSHHHFSRIEPTGNRSRQAPAETEWTVHNTTFKASAPVELRPVENTSLSWVDLNYGKEPTRMQIHNTV